MASGIEIAGVVLATLPLCIEIAKAYSESADKALNTTLPSRYDVRLEDFYNEFYWNISELDKHIVRIWDAASERYGHRPSALELSQWNERPDLVDNLKRFFKSDTAYHQYLLTTKRIASLLIQLIADKTTHLDQASLNENDMFKKLVDFADHRQSKARKSTFAERFRFFKKEKDRNRCIDQLERRNKRLEGLIEMAQAPHLRRVTASLSLSSTSNSPWNAIVLNIKDPSARICRLTRDLYMVLSRCWSCTCCEFHEAKFCLNIHGSEKLFSDTDAEFEFLVSLPPMGRSAGCWREGVVGVRAANSPLGTQDLELHKICEALSSCITGLGLRLLMEDINGQHHLWRLDPKPRRIPLLESKPPASLLDILSGSAMIGSYEKRELAIISAYSVLLLHDTPWLRSQWNKTHLSFFHKTENEPDFTRPFISTRFELPTWEVGSPESGVFHRNSLILDLGILLIEIFKEQPIERWRKEEERAVVSPATEHVINMEVAHRVVKKMDNTPSTSAIKACLDLDWIPQGQPVKLEDPEIRNGLLKNVIVPLETEIVMVS